MFKIGDEVIFNEKRIIAKFTHDTDDLWALEHLNESFKIIDINYSQPIVYVVNTGNNSRYYYEYQLLPILQLKVKLLIKEIQNEI
jgi:hypothetical protein